MPPPILFLVSKLYVTASQIQNMPRFNGGKSTRTEPYKLWKITGL